MSNLSADASRLVEAHLQTLGEKLEEMGVNFNINLNAENANVSWGSGSY